MNIKVTHGEYKNSCCIENWDKIFTLLHRTLITYWPFFSWTIIRSGSWKMIKIKCTFYVRRYTEKLFWAKRAMLTFFFLSQIHLLRISFCQNCMSMSQTKNCKLQPCPLGSAQQGIIACFVSKCYPSQLVVIKSIVSRK